MVIGPSGFEFPPMRMLIMWMYQKDPSSHLCLALKVLAILDSNSKVID